MVADEQSHTLPDSEDEELERIAPWLMRDADTFRGVAACLCRHRARHGRSSSRPPCSSRRRAFSRSAIWSFTGDDDDPDTLKTLANLGFERPSDIAG